MARRHLEAGGPVASPRSYADHHAVPADFVLPPDIDADEVVNAIEARLSELGSTPIQAPPLIERRAGRRVVVPGQHILRLGDGKFDRGRRFLHMIIGQIRARPRCLGKPE